MDSAHEPSLGASANPAPVRLIPPSTGEFAHHYALHAPRLGRFFRYYAPSPAEAEDLLAEASLTAWNLWPTFNPAEQAHAVWFFSIAQVVLHRRGAEPQPVRLERDPAQGLPTVAPAEPGTGDGAALSRPEREILALRYGGELSDVEIAQVTGLRRPHVHVIVQRALRRLGAHTPAGAQLSA